MQATEPKYLLIAISVVVSAVVVMYLMKEVFHIKAYPGRKSAESGIVATTPPESFEVASNAIESGEVQIQDEEDLDEDESDPVVADPIAPMDDEGFLDPDTYFRNLVDEYLQSLPEKLNGKRNRTDIVVRYYPHAGDEDKVRDLSGLSLYIHEREVDSGALNFQTNSIFYGDEVDTKDIQLIAYTLITNGVALKQIKPSKYHGDWKSRAVEIGADTTLSNQLVLSLEEIKAFDNVAAEAPER